MVRSGLFDEGNFDAVVVDYSSISLDYLDGEIDEPNWNLRETIPITVDIWEKLFRSHIQIKASILLSEISK